MENLIFYLTYCSKKYEYIARGIVVIKITVEVNPMKNGKSTVKINKTKGLKKNQSLYY